MSSGLNSLAAVVLEDFIKPWCRYKKKELSEMHATFYSKLLGQLIYLILTQLLSVLKTSN